MKKGKSLGFFFFLFLALLFLFLPGLLFAESGIYDRIGIIAEHGLHGAVPEEDIDLFTGNVILRYLDINLPGPNGLELKLWRVYNSKILKDRLLGGTAIIQQEPYSWVGMGWVMHMGRVHGWSGDTPIIEFPDGRWETTYLSTDGTANVTKDFLKYDKNNFKLYFRDGIVWTFGDVKDITYIDHTESVRLVTRIENFHGHHIDIIYQTGLPTLSKITDSLGREINFVTSGTTFPKLTRIDVKNAIGNTVSYSYVVGTFTGGYYKLTQFDPPELPASTFEYYSGQNNQFELTKVNTCYGGTLEYSYGNQTFYFYNSALDTRVVTQKTITFSVDFPSKTWAYTYPSYQNVPTGTVIIQGPEFNSNVTYNAYTSSTPWKIGLLSQRAFTDGSYSETYIWTSQIVSNTRWYVLGTDMGAITGPLVLTITKTRKGDATSKEEYLYERAGVKKYGLPTRINFYANTGSIKGYQTLSYFFETSATFQSKYMLSYTSDEKNYASGGTLLKETQTAYFESAGSCGAIDWIKRLKAGTTFLTWNYTYTSSNPNLVTITIDLPGSAGIETYEYRYGVLSKILRPGYTELTRTISQYDSSILSETNQHGGIMNFSYDNLGRITRIDMPAGFNAISASWATNSVTITQGGNSVVKNWDGMARDTGYTESGAGVTLYYRKTLDAEGRLISENKGSTNSADTYDYVISAMGQVKQITDPRGKITSISYSTNIKTVTDPETHVTKYVYNDLPGLVTKLTDAQNLSANSTYDGLGRLTKVVYNAARTQTYAFDGLDYVTSEAHPETGSMTYTYNTENDLSQRTWGAKTLNYSYNTSNQLTSLNAGDETITYEYDSMGRVNRISSTKSWDRNAVTYNSLGSVTGEIQNIPGLTSKTLSYTYDGNNNLAGATYPDGKSVSIANNGLNMPDSANFDTKSLISATSYGYSKQPTSITISGNSTSFSASYDAAGQLSISTLKKGTTTLYNANYSYDGVGNITAISNTTPQLNGTFGYDTRYRLTSASYSPSGVGRVNTFSYTYDNYGNMTKVIENTTTVFNKTYNAKNQISGFTYDNRGNLTSDGTYQYVWDNQNRLITLKNSSGLVLATYLYDERGLRLKADTFYVYSFDGKLLAEYDGSGNGLGDYIYSGQRLIAEFRPQENKYYYYTPDQINSVRMIADDSGAVVYSTTYDPYGGIEKAWVSTYDPALKFSGKERDAESGMDYFGARYYTGRLYRYLSADPVVDKNSAIFDPQTWNLYSYVRNNPISVFDPSGKKLIPVNLPGIGKTFLDDRFYADLERLISRTQEEGIGLTFWSAFRTEAKQIELHKKDPKRTAAPGKSPHEGGFAVDIHWEQLTQEQMTKVETIAGEIGISTGKKFSPSEPGHFYEEVPWGFEKRSEYVKLVRWEYLWVQLKTWFVKSFVPADSSRSK